MTQTLAPVYPPYLPPLAVVKALSERIKALPGRVAVFVGDRADQYRHEGRVMLDTSYLHALGEETRGPYPLRVGVCLSSGVEGLETGDVVGVLEHVSAICVNRGDPESISPYLPESGELRIYKVNVLDEVFKLSK